MHNVYALLLICLCFSVSIGATPHSIPLQQHRGKPHAIAPTLKAVSGRTSSLNGDGASLPPMDLGPHNFFYGSFDVGDSKVKPEHKSMVYNSHFTCFDGDRY